MAATLLSRKAVASVRPAFSTGRRSFVVRASAEQQTTPAPVEAPIAGVTVEQATPVAMPVAATPAAPSLFGE